MNIRRVVLFAAYAVTTCVFCAACFDVASCQAAENSEAPATGAVYDFFDYARYPVEGKLRSWVELRKVTTPTDTDPKTYAPRRVQWWPRKGIDYTELREGMIEREWTLSASALDPGYEPERFGGPETRDLDVLEFKWHSGEGFLRRVRGFLTPKESGDYTFKVSANDEGYILLSPDDKPANARVICHLSHWTDNVQWATASQTSRPQRLEAGKTYYFEIAHIDRRWRDFCEVRWSSGTRPEAKFAGDEFSTLDGRKSKFVEEKWSFRYDEGYPRLPDVPRTFKAHLIGFCGLGNELGEPNDKIDIVAPGVLLRFPDGRRRVFHRWMLCKEDQRFVMDLFVKEMARIRKTLDQSEYKGGDEVPAEGRVLYTSPHFVFIYAAHPKDEDPARRAQRDKFYRSAVAGAEYWYSYLEHGGHLMQFWERDAKNKHRVRVGGGNGGGYGGCTIGGITALPIALFHEYSHGMNLWWFGHPEIYCDFGQDLGTGGTENKNINNIRRPYRNALHSKYPTCFFLSVMSEDPNWGYCAPFAMPKAAAERHFYQSIARLAEQRGMCARGDGIRAAGDMVAEYGARLAELDIQNKDVIVRSWFSVMRNHLEPVDTAKGTYRIPWDEAPEAYGVNIIRLVAEPEAREVVVDFKGYHDPDIYSDWRACIVAVDKDGNTRYSDFWNKGVMTMPRQEGDRRYWLTVTAAPTALLTGPHGLLYTTSGRWAQRYPWQVTLVGARPDVPHRMRFDQDDYYSTFASMTAASILPTPANTPERRAFHETVRKAKQSVEGKLAATTHPYVRQCALALIGKTDHILEGAKGAAHPNGGGWVAATATVAPAAYVGPAAMVLDNAQVLDRACVEECAVVGGDARLSDHVRVGGQAQIGGKARLSGYQRAWYSVSAPEYDTELPDITPCDNTDAGKNGLRHNYALDDPSRVMLEDRFLFQGDYRHFTPMNNGYLYGEPTVVIDGERRGYGFNGASQYMELNSRATDMGQITIDMAVRPETTRAQTLLDCGADANNCMTLTLGAEGKPVFRATVAGKEAAGVTGNAAVPAGQWTRVRLEIDGASVALWINDKPAAKTASSFRPAHVFPGGVQKRNFIAATRDGKECFAGAIDYVVIYNRVHADRFVDLPPPMLDASCRPTERFNKELELAREQKSNRFREKPDDIMALAIKDQQPQNWATDVRAWDWRTKYELDGSIKKPLATQWLKRVRGDAPMHIIETK